MFASRIKNGKGANDSVDLKRSKDGGEVEEKEVITDSASFETEENTLFNHSTRTKMQDTSSKMRAKQWSLTTI